MSFDFSNIAPDVRRELRQLCKLDNFHGPLGVLLDYAVIAFSVYLCLGVSWWFYPISAILIGSTQRAFANLLHDSSHKILARNQKLNLLLGTVFSGYLILHLFNPYRNTHVGYHHRYLGDPEKDPDYSFHVDCGLYDHKESDLVFFGKNILLSALGFRTVRYIKYIIDDRVFCKAPQAKVSMPVSLRTERFAILAQWVVIVGVALAFGWAPYLLAFWFVPLFTTAIAIGWLTELAEHYPLPESEDKQVLMTRNRKGWAIENFLFGRHHDHYHLVHHLNTGVPFWNMKKAHRVLLRDEAYAGWDSMWAGILTRKPGDRGKETLISYASKYRKWRREGGDPASASTTFAEVLAMKHLADEQHELVGAGR
ncbi:fatty acid desaturase family protein [Micromonospora sp. R77]|uniref:fatty acid desaturase family protein n=1 Tax=Micromonospora sp. R77 TaxID=2925836 RepID=UPI001F604F8B|nr:fatty acid desaturase family protein [Micromonospora sp. R77]MCI4066898.1 fatty acid desaturase family protein [Micromonospora sp. R77]